MPLNQHESTRASLILLAVGIPCLLLSGIILSQRYDVAALVLGARFLFSLPFSSADSLKLLFVELVSVAGLLMSLTLIVAGVAVFARSSRAPIASEAVDAMATPR